MISISINRRKGIFACLAALLIAGCTSSSEGIRLDVNLMIHGSGGMAMAVPGAAALPMDHEMETPEPFMNDEGYTITLTKAYVVVTGVELVPCADAATASLGDSLRYLLGPVKAAHAHTHPDSDLESGAPVVADLFEILGMDQTVASLNPPAGEYCGATIAIGPADADAEGLPAEPDLVGKSIHFEGSYDDGGPVAFIYTSDEEAQATVMFMDSGHAETPVVLDRAGAASVSIGSRYDNWFDGVDFETMTDGDIASLIVSTIADSLHHMP